MKIKRFSLLLITKTLKPFLFVSLLCLSSCAALSASSALFSTAGAALEAIGLKTPSDVPSEVELSLQPGKNLNATSNNGNAVLIKIYHLQNIETWSNMNMEQLMDNFVTKNTLESDLVSVRELTLIPNTPYTSTETVTSPARYLGVVAFFHSPASYRWKYAFQVKDFENPNIVIGAHGCALSVPTGIPVVPQGHPPHDPKSLSLVKCSN